MVYLIDSVLPVLSNIVPPEVAEGAPTPDIQLEILRLLAEMSTYCGDLENAADQTTKVYDKLLVSSQPLIS